PLQLMGLGFGRTKLINGQTALNMSRPLSATGNKSDLLYVVADDQDAFFAGRLLVVCRYFFGQGSIGLLKERTHSLGRLHNFFGDVLTPFHSNRWMPGLDGVIHSRTEFPESLRGELDRSATQINREMLRQPLVGNTAEPVQLGRVPNTKTDDTLGILARL